MRSLVAAAGAVALVMASVAAAAAVTAPEEVKVEDMTVAASLTGQPGDPAKGRSVFSSRSLGNCLACHANADLANELFQGDVGPDLSDVGGRYEPEQLRAIVVDSKQVFGEQTVMPAFYHAITDQRVRKDLAGKPILTAEQVEDLVAYLVTLKGK